MSPKPRTSPTPATPGDHAHRRHRAIAARAMRDAEHLAESFERAAARVRHQRTTGAAVTDPAAVHDLRVATRRLSSALRLWRPVLHKSPRRAAARTLRGIRRAFGPVRDIEVHVEQVEARRNADSDMAPAALAALAALDRRLRKRYFGAHASALTTLEPPHAGSVGRDVARAFAGIRHRLAEPRARARVVARMRAVREDAQQAIGAACRAGIATDDETLHRARIAIKKLRYATERNAQAGRASAPLGRLRELQSALGRAHDAITFDTEIMRFAARSPVRKAALAPFAAMLRAEAQRHVARFLKRARTLEVMGASRKRAASPKTATPRRAARRSVSSRTPSSRAAGSSRESSPGT